ncbi:hypothetical protein FISHEDRAFT_56351 [Fistulina hepatica ATCC 64428]|uniref:Cation/H+ exchanger transmembrane domain-containing protein n=1 Tax=Fistulina hepatica ATCC 64428 TaxID=1128425 RepID=A0A0D7AJE1_9AGAR|nr:hypothetical protein FISHEDRAFT_56351 [Fistulina hepatica ATCC 64428]
MSESLSVPKTSWAVYKIRFSPALILSALNQFKAWAFTLKMGLLEVSEPGLAYIAVGGFVVAFSMMSLLIRERLYINEVVLGTGFGILMGPYVANAFNPRSWGSETDNITLEVMRVVLATGLFAIGVELPKSYMARHAKGLLVMVVPTMAIGWVVVAAIMYGLFPRLSYVSCLGIAACLTPTDPIISAAIVGGKFARKNVPLNIRHIISAESAANDGLAYPFLLISIYLTLSSSVRAAVGKWFLVGLLYEVILGIMLGAVIGLLFSYLMKFAHRKGFIDRESYVAQFLALAILTIGVAKTLGLDDLLAAFAAGSAISWDGDFNVHVEGEIFASVIDVILNCACFVYIGAWLPFHTWNSPDLGITPWRLVVLAICILFLRRIPCIMMLYRLVPEITSWKEALFVGHFGPMGVGAVYIQQFALEQLGGVITDEAPTNQTEWLTACIQPVVSFIVLCSIIVHGLSIPGFSFSRSFSRTLSISRTATRAAQTPDWLSWIRHGDPVPTVHASSVSPTVRSMISDIADGQNAGPPSNATKEQQQQQSGGGAPEGETILPKTHPEQPLQLAPAHINTATTPAPTALTTRIGSPFNDKSMPTGYMVDWTFM